MKIKLLEKIDKFTEKFLRKYFEIKDKENFSTKQKVIFLKQLGYLLKGGVSVFDAIELIYNQTQNFAIKNICKVLLKQLNEGKNLYSSLSSLPDFFNYTDIGIVKTGEKSGNLPMILELLSQEYDYLLTLKSKYQSALMYPVFLLILSLGIIIAMFSYVLPSVFDTILGMGVKDIPKTTLILKGISDFFIQNGKYIGIGLVLIFLILSFVLSTNQGKKFFWKTLYNMPLVGQITKYYFLIKFLRYLKITLYSGMNYYEVFYLLKDVLKNPIYQDLLEEILSNIRKGKPIYYSLQNWYDIIPADVVTMIKVGEETATLGKTIDSIIEIYDKELEKIISTSSKLMEPILLVIIGIVVGFIAIGIFGLIYKLMDSVGF